MIDSEAIRARMRAFRSDLETYCREQSVGIPEIIAVTKKQPEWKIKIALQEGFTKLGENYVQEARKKYDILQQASELHLLGPLQTGNINRALKIFDFIHAIHSEKILLELEKKASRQEKQIPVLLEIKTSPEPTKSGLSPAEAIQLARNIESGEIILSSVKIQGVMTIAPLSTMDDARIAFKKCKSTGREIAQILKIKEPIYSYGMSADYKIAIQEGSNMIRIGTKLFGPRD